MGVQPLSTVRFFQYEYQDKTYWCYRSHWLHPYYWCECSHPWFLSCWVPPQWTLSHCPCCPRCITNGLIIEVTRVEKAWDWSSGRCEVVIVVWFFWIMIKVVERVQLYLNTLFLVLSKNLLKVYCTTRQHTPKMVKFRRQGLKRICSFLILFFMSSWLNSCLCQKLFSPPLLLKL